MVDLFSFPPEKIRIIQTETGGAFGGKEDFSSVISAHAALLAWKSGKPVKLAYDRHEDMLATTKRHPSLSRYKTGVTADGKIVAMEIDFILDGGAYSTMSPVVLSRGTIHASGPYFYPNISIKGRAVATNTPPHGAFRGFGAPQSFFALEKHMNDVVKELDIDPAKFRKMNFIKDGQKTATGQIIQDNVRMDRILDRALMISDYQNKIKEYALNNKKSKVLKGIGISTFLHGSGFTGSGEKMLASVVDVEATASGRIQILASSTEMGQGKNTIFTQIAADALNISPEYIDVIFPDTSKVPNSGPTVASRTTMIVGKLVETSSQELKKTLYKSNLLKKKYSSENFINACKSYIKKNDKLRISSQYKHPSHIQWDESTHKGDAYATYAWAANVAVVSIDTTTYEVKVDGFYAVQEIGKVVNPSLAEGQIQGGIVQAIGFTLYEKVIWKNGKMVNNQFTNYVVPGIADVPKITVEFIEVPYSGGPSGAKGIGELPMDGPAPAIANAIENATGFHFNHIPILPEDIMQRFNKK